MVNYVHYRERNWKRKVLVINVEIRVHVYENVSEQYTIRTNLNHLEYLHALNNNLNFLKGHQCGDSDLNLGNVVASIVNIELFPRVGELHFRDCHLGRYAFSR